MKIKDYIQIIAIFITLAVSLITLIFNYISSQRAAKANEIMAQKARRANITSIRRKERMEKLIECFSKMSALLHPLTIRQYSNISKNYTGEILTYFENINMLLNGSFEKDVELTSLIKRFVEDAVDYYIKIAASENEENYVCNYINYICKTRKLFNIYIGAEWGRIQIESETGEKVTFEKWLEMYNETKGYYEKWNPIDS